MTLDTMGGRGEAETRLKQRYAEAHERLMNGRTPPAKPKRQRPVSPFRREEKNPVVEKLREKAMTTDPAVLTVFPNLFTEVSATFPPSATILPTMVQKVVPTVEVVDLRTLSWREIVNEVCSKHGVSFIDIRSPRRNRPVVLARHEAFWRIRQETTLSLPQIGRVIGGRDHSTVMAGIKKHEMRMAEAVK